MHYDSAAAGSYRDAEIVDKQAAPIKDGFHSDRDNMQSYWTDKLMPYECLASVSTP